MSKLRDIVKELHNNILDIVGEEFAPKQEGGSSERKQLLGLIVQTGPLVPETETKIKNLFLEIVGISERSDNPLASLIKQIEEL